jgi:hypothetical protein
MEGSMANKGSGGMSFSQNKTGEAGFGLNRENALKVV